MATILITGGTGLVGRALAKELLEKGFRVCVLSRNKQLKSQTQGLHYAWWNQDEGYMEGDLLNEISYIVNLAGAGVMDKKWTEAYRKKIVDSRVSAGNLIVDFIRSRPNQVKAVVSASAIGWYGPDTKSNQQGFAEEAPANKDFLGETCRLWEESVAPLQGLGVRLVIFRIGIVLSKQGGALAEFLKPLRFGIAPIVGSGNQVISWIHESDLCRLISFAISREEMRGVFNAVAPHPVTNKNFMLKLGKIYRGAFFVPIWIPAFLLKVMLGKRSIEILKSATVSCSKISQAGFVFQFPSVEAAFEQLLRRRTS